MFTQLDQNPISVVSMGVARLRPYTGNARTHSKKQIRQIADSIRKFGFTNPVLISDEDEISPGMDGLKQPSFSGCRAFRRFACPISIRLRDGLMSSPTTSLR